MTIVRRSDWSTYFHNQTTLWSHVRPTVGFTSTLLSREAQGDVETSTNPKDKSEYCPMKSLQPPFGMDAFIVQTYQHEDFVKNIYRKKTSFAVFWGGERFDKHCHPDEKERKKKKGKGVWYPIWPWYTCMAIPESCDIALPWYLKKKVRRRQRQHWHCVRGRRPLRAADDDTGRRRRSRDEAEPESATRTGIQADDDSRRPSLRARWRTAGGPAPRRVASNTRSVQRLWEVFTFQALRAHFGTPNIQSAVPDTTWG
jgi:hypothetical protein